MIGPIQPKPRTGRRISPGPEGLPPDLNRNLTREEITLAEFPVTTMAQRRPNTTTLAVEEFIGTDIDGNAIYRTWTIVGSERYGLPLAGDEDIYVVIVKMLEHRDFAERVIACTRYQICQLLDVPPDGRVYLRISDALTRLANTKFVAENVFRDPTTGALVKREAFGMIDAFRFVDRVPKRTKSLQQELPLSYIRVADEFLRRLKDGKLKRLDLEFWRSLSTPLTRRLFRFLDKNRYRKEEYEIGVVKLGTRLGLATSNPAKEMKRLLTRPIHELKDRGFLSEYAFTVSRGLSKVTFRFDPTYDAARLDQRMAFNAQEPLRKLTARRLTRNSTLPGTPPDDAYALAVHFSEVFHHVVKDTVTPADQKTAAELLARCAGDVAVAKAAIQLAYKETRDWNPPASNFRAVLTNDFPERAVTFRKREADSTARAEAQRHQDQAMAQAHAELAAATRERFDALPEGEREALVGTQEKRLHEFMRGRPSQWTPEAREKWLVGSAIEEYRRTRMPTVTQWLQGLRERPGDTPSGS